MIIAELLHIHDAPPIAEKPATCVTTMEDPGEDSVVTDEVTLASELDFLRATSTL
jgi:hypothetical protein